MNIGGWTLQYFQVVFTKCLFSYPLVYSKQFLLIFVHSDSSENYKTLSFRPLTFIGKS